MRPSARCAFLDRPCGLMSERQLVTMAMMLLKLPCSKDRLYMRGARGLTMTILYLGLKATVALSDLSHAAVTSLQRASAPIGTQLRS